MPGDSGRREFWNTYGNIRKKGVIVREGVHGEEEREDGISLRGAREEVLLILKEVASKRMRAETLGKLVS